MTYPQSTALTYPLYQHQAFKRLDSLASVIMRLSFTKVTPKITKDKLQGTGSQEDTFFVNEDYYKRVITFLEREHFTVNERKGILTATNFGGDRISIKSNGALVRVEWSTGDYPAQSRSARFSSALRKYPWTAAAIVMWTAFMSWYASSHIETFEYEWEGLYIPAALAALLPLATLLIEDIRFGRRYAGYYPQNSRASLARYYPRTLGLAVILGLLMCVPDSIIHGVGSGWIFGLGMALTFPVAAAVAVPILWLVAKSVLR